LLGVLGVGALALTACSSGSPGQPRTSSTTTTTVQPSSSTTSTPTPTGPERSYLNGVVGAPNGPVLAVKMDNTPASNPHSGLLAADIVYLEQVEGGLSRFAAIYSTSIPAVVGPVRSARITDIELLAQFGRIAFAYSGAQPRMLPVLAAANLYNVSADESGLGYFREFDRVSPENLFATTRTLLGRAPNAAVARNIGFTFSTSIPGGGRPVTSVSASYPATTVTFVWSAAQQRWLVAMNGVPAMATEGGQLGGKNVIIQYVTLTPSIYYDVLHHNTPMSTTVGTGTDLIFRNGMAYAGTWSRPQQYDGTTWYVNGHQFPLEPGQTWVVLINKATPATIG
jgi:Protein of unknown function (DUF3048) N-terminal domain/Protein of unknown function (DUF3048) C-terminal domain